MRFRPSLQKETVLQTVCRNYRLSLPVKLSGRLSGCHVSGPTFGITPVVIWMITMMLSSGTDPEFTAYQTVFLPLEDKSVVAE